MRAFALLAALVAACSSPDPGDDGDDDGSVGGGNLDADLAVLDAALARVHAVVAAGPDFTYDTLRAAALADDHVQLADTAPDGALWISANGGPLAVIVIDPSPTTPMVAPQFAPRFAPTFAPTVATPSATPSQTALAASAGIELPAKATFRAYDVLGPGFTDPTPDIARMLRASGYTAESTAPATVEELRNVKDVGVLFIKSHGEIKSTATGSASSVPFYTLYTATPYPDAAEEAILATRDDWYTHRVVVFDAVNRQGWIAGVIPDTHYAITDSFVKTYMNVADHGVVLLEACQSGSPTGAAFGAAFTKAASYVGWNGNANATTADNTMRYLVDRMLGANDSSTPRESPKQRAFELSALDADIVAKHLDSTTSPQGVAHVAYMGDAILAPSLRNIDVDETAKTLTLHGSFGSRPDTVALGTESLAIHSWSSDTIVTDVPHAGGSAVVLVDNRKSNPVQLTDWNNGTLTYKVSGVGAGITYVETFTWHPHMRADLHAFRTAPGIAPPDRTPIKIGLAADSTCHYKHEGAFIGDGIVITASGEGDFVILTTENPPGGGCLFEATLDLHDGATAVSTRAYAFAPAGLTLSANAPGFPIGPLPVGTATEPYTDPSNFGLAMTRDTSFTLTAGSGTPAPITLPDTDGAGIVLMSWTAFPASFPPDPDAAR